MSDIGYPMRALLALCMVALLAGCATPPSYTGSSAYSLNEIKALIETSTVHFSDAALRDEQTFTRALSEGRVPGWDSLNQYAARNPGFDRAAFIRSLLEQERARRASRWAQASAEQIERATPSQICGVEVIEKFGSITFKKNPLLNPVGALKAAGAGTAAGAAAGGL